MMSSAPAARASFAFSSVETGADHASADVVRHLNEQQATPPAAAWISAISPFFNGYVS